jgi:outer membrane lipoprotein carrier protein
MLPSVTLAQLTPEQPAKPTEIALRLQSTYEHAANMVADFDQTTSMQFSNRVRKGTGTLIFMKPGRMRWDYVKPDHQILISDGKSVSMYFEKSNQMVISDARDYLQSDVTYSFFTGSGDILKDFDTVAPEFQNEADNSYLIKLIPRSPHPQVAYMYAWVSKDTFLLKHLQIVDHFDTVTDLFFYNMQIDANSYDGHPVSEDLFYFTPPDGTEIIRQ